MSRSEDDKAYEQGVRDGLQGGLLADFAHSFKGIGGRRSDIHDKGYDWGQKHRYDPRHETDHPPRTKRLAKSRRTVSSRQSSRPPTSREDPKDAWATMITALLFGGAITPLAREMFGPTGATISWIVFTLVFLLGLHGVLKDTALGGSGFLILVIIVAIAVILGVSSNQPSPPQQTYSPPQQAYVPPTPLLFKSIPAYGFHSISSAPFRLSSWGSFETMGGPKGDLPCGRGIYIRGTSLDVQPGGVEVDFEVSSAEGTPEILLYAPRNVIGNSIGPSQRVSERLYLTDDQGHKFYSTTGFLGGRQVQFNRVTRGVKIPAHGVVPLKCRFPIPARGAATFKFVSPNPDQAGHQSEWWIDNLPIFQ